jgi:hypothetical protein
MEAQGPEPKDVVVQHVKDVEHEAVVIPRLIHFKCPYIRKEYFRNMPCIP